MKPRIACSVYDNDSRICTRVFLYFKVKFFFFFFRKKKSFVNIRFPNFHRKNENNKEDFFFFFLYSNVRFGIDVSFQSQFSSFSQIIRSKY